MVGLTSGQRGQPTSEKTDPPNQSKQPLVNTFPRKQGLTGRSRASLEPTDEGFRRRRTISEIPFHHTTQKAGQLP